MKRRRRWASTLGDDCEWLVYLRLPTSNTSSPMMNIMRLHHSLRPITFERAGLEYSGYNTDRPSNHIARSAATARGAEQCGSYGDPWKHRTGTEYWRWRACSMRILCSRYAYGSVQSTWSVIAPLFGEV